MEKAQKKPDGKARESKGAKIKVVLLCWFGDKPPNTELMLSKDIADGLISRGNAKLVEMRKRQDNVYS